MHKLKHFSLLIIVFLMQNTLVAQKIQLDRVVVINSIDEVSALHFLDSLSRAFDWDDCQLFGTFVTVIRNRIVKQYRLQKRRLV